MLAVLAALAMAFAVFVLITDVDENDAGNIVDLDSQAVDIPDTSGYAYTVSTKTLAISNYSSITDTFKGTGITITGEVTEDQIGALGFGAMKEDSSTLYYTTLDLAVIAINSALIQDVTIKVLADHTGIYNALLQTGSSSSYSSSEYSVTIDLNNKTYITTPTGAVGTGGLDDKIMYFWFGANELTIKDGIIRANPSNTEGSVLMKSFMPTLNLSNIILDASSVNSTSNPQFLTDLDGVKKGTALYIGNGTVNLTGGTRIIGSDNVSAVTVYGHGQSTSPGVWTSYVGSTVIMDKATIDGNVIVATQKVTAAPKVVPATLTITKADMVGDIIVVPDDVVINANGKTSAADGTKTVTITDLTIPTGGAMSVKNGQTLTISGSLTNFGTLENNGTIINNGTIVLNSNNGFVSNTGSYPEFTNAYRGLNGNVELNVSIGVTAIVFPTGDLNIISQSSSAGLFAYMSETKDGTKHSLNVTESTFTGSLWVAEANNVSVTGSTFGSSDAKLVEMMDVGINNGIYENDSTDARAGALWIVDCTGDIIIGTSESGGGNKIYASTAGDNSSSARDGQSHGIRCVAISAKGDERVSSISIVNNEFHGGMNAIQSNHCYGTGTTLTITGNTFDCWGMTDTATTQGGYAMRLHFNAALGNVVVNDNTFIKAFDSTKLYEVGNLLKASFASGSVSGNAISFANNIYKASVSATSEVITTSTSLDAVDGKYTFVNYGTYIAGSDLEKTGAYYGSFIVPTEQTATVGNGTTMTFYDQVTVEGTLVVSGVLNLVGTLTNSGIISGEGMFTNSGVLINEAGVLDTITCVPSGGSYKLIIPAKTDAVYKGTKTLAFKSIPTGIGNETVTLTYTTYAADAGKVQTYTYEATPSASGEFTVEASDSSATRTFTIASAGDLTIGKALLNDVTLALTSDSGQYTGVAQNPGFTVKIGDQDVSADFNAASWPDDMINAGSKTLTLTSKNENIESGNKTATYTITQAENGITAVTIAGWTYGANPSVPTTTAVFGGTTATYLYKLTSAGEGAYSSTVPTDAGAYDIKATIAETSNYKGATGTATFTIAPLSITGATVTLGDPLTYNGSAQTQAVTKITVSTVDYNIGTGLAVSDNVQTNVKTDGDYTLTVTGSGNFTGSATKTWNISPLSVSTLDVTIKNGDATITRGERIAYDEKGYTLTYAVDGYASPATIASKWQIKNGETWTDTDTIKNSGEYQLVLTGSTNFTGTQAFAGPVIAEAKEVEHVDETTHKTTEDATVTADTDSVSISNDSEFTVGDDKKVEINLQTTFESGSDGKAKIEFPEGTVFNEGNESSVISLVNITPAGPEAAPTFEIVFENVTVTTVTITLPIGTGLTNPAVYYVPGGSAEKVLMGGTYDAVAGTITFTTTHNSTYEVQQSETPVTHNVNITAGSGGTVSQTTVTGVADNASISASGSTLTIGTTTVTATASSGYTFSSWSGIPASGKVTENLNIKANFTSSPGPTPPGPGPGPSPTITYTLTFEAGTGGSVSPATVKAAINANISVNGDTMIIGTGTSAKTVKAIPNDGYTVGTWSVTSGKVTSDMTISVTFKKVSLTEISVKNAPTKVSYKEGEKFDPAGLSIMLKYDDMTFKVLPYKGNESQFSFSPSLATPLKTSDKTVTITFEGKSTTQAIVVSGDSPSGGNDNTVLYVVIAAIVVIFAAGAVFYFVKKKPAE